MGLAEAIAAAATGAAAGVAFATARLARTTALPSSLAAHRAALRASLPKHVILVRHGESEGNADQTLYRNKPDNQIELTALGSRQAVRSEA